jgi:hypothetical protein
MKREKLRIIIILTKHDESNEQLIFFNIQKKSYYFTDKISVLSCHDLRNKMKQIFEYP